MSTKADGYSQKLATFKEQTAFYSLAKKAQVTLAKLASQMRWSFQEFRQVVEAQRDLTLWREDDVPTWWQGVEVKEGLDSVALKRFFFKEFNAYLHELKSEAKAYPEDGVSLVKPQDKGKAVTRESGKTIMGMCPVASERTVCCNLRTIDAVENCTFGCSYCSVQTFYSKNFVFDAHFADKLNAIELEENRFYHIGTGQSSDALVWGNKNGNLDALKEFALKHPHILLELKTKSDNVKYFEENETPHNMIPSWSLNTQTIVENEEHFTASLDKRIKAAQRAVAVGKKVAFHFHPMVYYAGWEADYPDIAKRLLTTFSYEDVLFLSMGSVTLIKPVMKNIRNLGNPSKILQMDFVKDPHGKFTYPDDIKTQMFSTQYQAFAPWHDKVFMYLCMEKESLWIPTFGYAYETNELFEERFGQSVMAKIT